MGMLTFSGQRRKQADAIREANEKLNREVADRAELFLAKRREEEANDLEEKAKSKKVAIGKGQVKEEDFGDESLEENTTHDMVPDENLKPVADGTVKPADKPPTPTVHSKRLVGPHEDGDEDLVVRAAKKEIARKDGVSEKDAEKEVAKAVSPARAVAKKEAEDREIHDQNIELKNKVENALAEKTQAHKNAPSQDVADKVAARKEAVAKDVTDEDLTDKEAGKEAAKRQDAERNAAKKEAGAK